MSNALAVSPLCNPLGLVRVDIGGACPLCLAATPNARFDAFCFAHAGGEPVVVQLRFGVDEHKPANYIFLG